MAEKTKPPAGDGKNGGDAGASGTDVNVHRSDDGQLIVIFENKPSPKTTTNKVVVEGMGGGNAGENDKAKAESTPPVDPPPAPSHKDCLEMIEGIHERALDRFMKTGDYISKVRKESFEEGKNCCPDKEKVAERTTPPVKEVQSSSGSSWIKTALIIVGALVLAYLILTQLKGCGALGGGDVTPVTPTVNEKGEPCCLDEYKEGLRDGVQLSRETSYVPEPSEDDREAPEQTRKASTAPTPGQFQAANAALAMMVFDCLGKNPNLLRFVGDSLDGEHKKILLAGVLATAVANGKGPDFSGPRPKLVDASYAPGTHYFCQQMGFHAHETVRYGKYEGSEVREESFNYWVNIAYDPLQHTAETEFSIAVDETLDVLHQALRDRGYNSFHGIQVAQTTRTRQTSGGSALASAPPKGKAKGKALLSPLNMATAPYRSLGYISPIPSGYTVVSGGKFGIWRDSRRYHHKGEDLATTREGPNVVHPSPVIGRVVSVGFETGFGKCVRVDIGKAEIIFAHLRSYGPGIKTGVKVRQGVKIGEVGTTGNAKRPHLHIEFVPKSIDFVIPIFKKE